jgi:chromosome segregation ATPase
MGFLAADPSATPGQPWWVYMIMGLLSTGSGKFIWDTYKDWRSQPSKVMRESTDIDASIVTVARARDELEADNVRLRQELIESEERHSRERERWLGDQERLRADVARLEAQIRAERQEANDRYDALLKQIQRLGHKAAEVSEGMQADEKDRRHDQ